MLSRFTSLSVAALAGLLLTTACGGNDANDPKDPNLIAFNDYESVVGWMGDVHTVSRDQAHSGRYAVKVENGSDFGMGYGLALGKASARKPHKIHIQAWGYMTDGQSNARLGVQLFDPATGKETFGDGIDYSSAIKDLRKWVKIEKDIVLPPTATPTQELRVFLWKGPANTPAYLDDLRITLVD